MELNVTAVEQAIAHAVHVARRLKPKGQTREVAAEYVRETAPLFIASGLTEQEATACNVRIWLAVINEAQA